MSDKTPNYIKQPKILRNLNNDERKTDNKSIYTKVDNIVAKGNLKSQKNKNDKLKATPIVIACERRIKVEHINEALNENITEDNIKEFLNNILQYNNKNCKNNNEKEDILFIGNFEDINSKVVRNYIIENTERINFITNEDFDKFKSANDSVINSIATINPINNPKTTVLNDTIVQRKKTTHSKVKKNDKRIKIAEKVEVEKVEAEKVEVEKVEAEKVEVEKVEAEKVEAEKVERCRIKGDNKYYKQAYQADKIKDFNQFGNRILKHDYLCEIFHIMSNKDKINEKAFSKVGIKEIKNCNTANEFLKKKLEKYLSKNKTDEKTMTYENMKEEVNDNTLDKFAYDSVSGELSYEKKVIHQRNKSK